MELGRSALAGAVAFLGFALGSGDARAADVTVNPLQQLQRIDGFGASSAWTAHSMTTNDADLAFSVDDGVGLSLLRVRIRPCDTVTPCQLTTDELATAKAAAARGARVWAAPWSPPAAWKTDFRDAGQSVNGGTLMPEHYDDWAQALVGFVGWMHQNGVDLAGLSPQNEPEFPCSTYECCDYSPTQLADFVTNHLGPALQNAGALQGMTFGLITPETQGWRTFPSFSGAVLNAASGTSFVQTIATHEYNGDPSMNPGANQAVASAGKRFWETEVYPQTFLFKNADPGIDPALWVAQMIHSSLVVAGMNAWHYWWLYSSQADNQGLWDNTTNLPTKRLYAMGNFSKFVRPGFYRVATTDDPSSDVLVSAYFDGPSATLVIVAVNLGTTDVARSFALNGVTTGHWSAYVTSAASDMRTAAAAPISNNLEVDYTLPARSITTLQGLVLGSGPTYGHGTGIDCAVSDAPREAPRDVWAEASAVGGGLLVLGLVAVRRRARRS